MCELKASSLKSRDEEQKYIVASTQHKKGTSGHAKWPRMVKVSG